MPKNTSISLGDHFNDFVADRVATGRYGSVSDVVRAGLRLLEDHESRVEALRSALVAGETSGPVTPFDLDVFVQERRSKASAQVSGWRLSPAARAYLQEIWDSAP